jgi:hypothetical protein
MRRWIVEPEVAGQLGSNTIMDTTKHPPVVVHLHHEFEGWLGDDLIECFPCFLVTERLAEALSKFQATGFELRKVEISRSETFTDLYPNRALPRFWWLSVACNDANSDLRLCTDGRLNVSDRVYKLLCRFNVDNAIIRDSEELA